MDGVEEERPGMAIATTGVLSRFRAEREPVGLDLDRTRRKDTIENPELL